eukprot:3811047-Prymnesium_polylepis.1
MQRSSVRFPRRSRRIFSHWSAEICSACPDEAPSILRTGTCSINEFPNFRTVGGTRQHGPGRFTLSKPNPGRGASSHLSPRVFLAVFPRTVRLNKSRSRRQEAGG